MILDAQLSIYLQFFSHLLKKKNNQAYSVLIS